MHRQRERLGRRQARVELVVDEQAPHVAVGDPADEVLDVDAAVAQRAAFLVRLGDLGLEGDDAFEAGLEVRHLSLPRRLCRALVARASVWRLGRPAGAGIRPYAARATDRAVLQPSAMDGRTAAPTLGGPAPRVRRRGAGRGRPRRRPVRAVRPLARRRRRRAGVRSSPTRWCSRRADADGRARARGPCCSRASTSAASSFFTNYGSRKGRELAANPRASAGLPLARARAPGAWSTGDGRAGRPRRDRGLLRGPAARLAARRVGQPRSPSVLAGPGGARASGTPSSRARWPEGADVPVPDFWGGLPGRARTGRVLAGPADRLHDRLRYVPRRVRLAVGAGSRRSELWRR